MPVFPAPFGVNRHARLSPAAPRPSRAYEAHRKSPLPTGGEGTAGPRTCRGPVAKQRLDEPAPFGGVSSAAGSILTRRAPHPGEEPGERVRGARFLEFESGAARRRDARARLRDRPTRPRCRGVPTERVHRRLTLRAGRRRFRWTSRRRAFTLVEQIVVAQHRGFAAAATNRPQDRSRRAGRPAWSTPATATGRAGASSTANRRSRAGPG